MTISLFQIIQSIYGSGKRIKVGFFCFFLQF